MLLVKRLKAALSSMVLGLIAALALAGSLLMYGRSEARKGAKDANRIAKEKDHEQAMAIRNRVERDLPGRLREYDDAGFRD